MTQPDLFAIPPPPTVTSTSRANFDRLPLPLADLLVCRLLADYTAVTGHQDATGRELAEWAGREVLSVRPRLTGAFQAGWLEKSPARLSRSRHERPSQPYRLAVPVGAIDQAIIAEG